MQKFRLIFNILTVVCGLTFVLGAPAVTMAATAEKPLLTITGNIAPAGGGNTLTFDRAGLEAVGMQTIETTTPWYPGVAKFEGVSLAKLMQLANAQGTMITAVALNDYSSDIPIEDFAKYNVILALKRDGAYMPITDKGPLFVMYPFDSSAELKNQKFYSRAVWQVAKIIVK